MRKFYSALLAAAVMSLSPLVIAAESGGEEKIGFSAIKEMLPPPDSGFEWALFRNCAFQTPAGWNTRVMPDIPEKKTGVFAQSPEEFSEQKQFEHGFTVQVIPEFSKATGLKPAKGAIGMIKQTSDQRPESDVLIFDNAKSPLGLTFTFRYNDAPADKTPIVIHKYFIADDKSDVLYIFVYESPKESWDSNWKTFGTPLMKKIAVLPFLSPTP